jgi:hypothetical protein
MLSHEPFGKKITIANLFGFVVFGQSGLDSDRHFFVFLFPFKIGFELHGYGFERREPLPYCEKGTSK